MQVRGKIQTTWGKKVKEEENKKKQNKNSKIIVNDRLDSLLRPLLIWEPSLLRKYLAVYNITIYRKRCMWMIYFLEFFYYCPLSARSIG
jgi:hypothetical protein